MSAGCRRLPVTLFGLALFAFGLLSGCGSSTHNTPPPPATGDRFTAPPTLRQLDVAVEAEEPLADAFERVYQAYVVENHQPFDARRAYATSAAAGFAKYFTINEPDDPRGRTNHVFFVVTAPWTESNTRSFLLSYLVMPAAPESEVGRPWFHFHSAYEPPWAVRFVFGNSSPGSLEAAVLSELGTTGWQPENVTHIASRIVALLERVEMAHSEALAESCPTVLDEIFTALPRPPAGEPAGVFGAEYLPEGTLAALGLLVGESIRAHLPGAVEWEEDDGAVYPRLRVSGVAEGIMRPIPMMVEIFAAGADVMPSTYCRRMTENLTERLGGE